MKQFYESPSLLIFVNAKLHLNSVMSSMASVYWVINITSIIAQVSKQSMIRVTNVDKTKTHNHFVDMLLYN